MQKDVVAFYAPVVLGEQYIGLTGYDYVNQILPSFKKCNPVPQGMPRVHLDEVNNAAHNHLGYSLYIFNQTAQDVVIVYRDGSRDIIPPIKGHYNQRLILRTVKITHKNVGPKLDRFYMKTDNGHHPDSHEFQLMRQHYLDARGAVSNAHMCTILDAIIDEADIKKHNSLYIENRDIVISFEEVDEAPNHPFDRAGISLERSEAMLGRKSGTNVIVEIIDNDQTIGPQYYYTLTGLQTVLPQKDHSRQNGIYIYSNTWNKNNECEHNAQYYPLAECEKLGLYSTQEAAKNAGDIKAQREMELETKRHENKMLQASMEELKANKDLQIESLKQEHREAELNWKTRLIELEAATKTADHARALEAERLAMEKIHASRISEYEKYHYDSRSRYRDDYYDERSHYRKDNSELLKFVPALLTAGIGAWAYFSSKK